MSSLFRRLLEKPSSSSSSHEQDMMPVLYAQEQPSEKKSSKKHPCCDCPETKRARDSCMLERGSEEECQWVIEAHNMCMEFTTKDAVLQKIRDSGAEDRVPQKKICCSCPISKKYRDECVVEHGPEKCEWLIEGHKMCLRNEGFKIE